MTLPGVVAMFTPSSKALESVIEIFSLPLPRSMSSSRLCRPRTRFWPPEAIVARNTSGLVSAKLVGENASMYCRVKKSTLRFVESSRPSTLATWSCSQRAVSRYDCLMKSNRKCCSQSSCLKRLSPLCGSAMGPVGAPIMRMSDDCHRLM